jgi:hypothetical protein
VKNSGSKSVRAVSTAYQDIANAVSLNAIGVIAQDVFVRNSRLAVESGLGWGQSSFMSYDQGSEVGGRAGLQAHAKKRIAPQKEAN